MADNYFVTAVLVSHDGAEWLPEVIASIFSQSRPVDRIIAVDNGSQDGSTKLISNAGITLIKMIVNLVLVMLLNLLLILQSQSNQIKKS